MTRFLVSRPRWDLTDAQIIKHHKDGTPVPMTQYTVTIESDDEPPQHFTPAPAST